MNVWKSSIKNYSQSWNSILTQFEVRKLNNHEISWNRPFLTSKLRNYTEAYKALTKNIEDKQGGGVG